MERWDTAEVLTGLNYQADPRYQRFLFGLWQRIVQTAPGSEEKDTASKNMINLFESSPYLR